MIKKLLTVSLIIALFASCNNSDRNTEDIDNDSTVVDVISEEIPEILLADFDTKAGSFVDKKVTVSGIVDHVCKHGGKKYY
ncbi:MAG: hypothetical protein JXR51_01515 [Bacteroidales bacterium]|nr:hypothetical protein [Bacteroidales bacterium]MBN2755822.1 hypothetical protein [Bacteroidales bacterium]